MATNDTNTLTASITALVAAVSIAEAALTTAKGTLATALMAQGLSDSQAKLLVQQLPATTAAGTINALISAGATAQSK